MIITQDIRSVYFFFLCVYYCQVLCLSPQTNVTLQNLALNVNYSVEVSVGLLQLKSTTCCFSLKRVCKWHFIFLFRSLILGGWGGRQVRQQPVELHVPTLPLKGDLLHCRSELVTVDVGMIRALQCTSISVSLACCHSPTYEPGTRLASSLPLALLGRT